MPPITQHRSLSSAKLLVAGVQGTGKSGALISLVKAGYKLRILDFDNGLDYLTALIQSECPDLASNVHFETLEDDWAMTSKGISLLGKPQALMKAFRLIGGWSTPTEDLGPVSSWGPDCVLVIDSLTFAGYAALNFIIDLNGRNQSPIRIQDWGDAAEQIRKMLDFLKSDTIKCNVIVNTHIRAETTELKNSKGELTSTFTEFFPEAIGKKLPRKVGCFFNSVLQLVRKGTGPYSERVFLTEPNEQLDLKKSNPSIPSELPISTGLADFLFAACGKKPNNLGETNGTNQRPSFASIPSGDEAK